MRPFRFLYIGLTALAACGGGDEPSGPPAPTSIALVSGGSQTGQVGTILAQSVVVRVTAGSQPVSGVRVTFVVEVGGGTISPTSVTTDGNGTATATWILGGTLGQQTATANVTALSPLTIPATATVGPPTRPHRSRGSQPIQHRRAPGGDQAQGEAR